MSNWWLQLLLDFIEGLNTIGYLLLHHNIFLHLNVSLKDKFEIVKLINLTDYRILHKKLSDYFVIHHYF